VSKPTDKSLNEHWQPDQVNPPLPDRFKYLSHHQTEIAASPGPISPELQIGLLRHELQDAQDRYSLLYDFTPNAYLTLDPRAIVIEINLTLCNWLEVDRDSLKGADFAEYVAPEFRALFASHLTSTLNGTPKQQCEIFLKKKTGSFLAVSLESTAVRDERGQMSRVFCSLKDITQLHKQIESGRLFQLVMGLADQAIITTDKNLMITNWNKAASALFGWKIEEVQGKQANAQTRGKFLEQLINDSVLKELAEAGIWSGQINCLRKDSTKFNWQGAIGVIWDKRGNFNGLAIVGRLPASPLISHDSQIDGASLEELVNERTQELSHTIQLLQHEISMHKQAALAARESEGKNRDLVDNIKLGIFRCTPGPKGGFLEVNKAMEEISGFSREELLQIPVCDLIFNHDNPQPFQNMINIADWKITREMRIKTRQGDFVTVAVTVVAIRFESGATQYFDGILEDITERKQAQIQIQESLQRLQKTIKEIIEAMAYIGEVRDPYTAGHQRRVAQLSLKIAQAMGLQEEQFEGLTMAAFVHDIGKILVPSDILSKPGKLTRPEFDMLRDHTRIGYEILKTIEFPWPIATIVLQHHERIDGSGYPNGLAGDQIIIEARILAVADVVEAMSSHRPYRPALGIDLALDEITKNRGTLYDPAVVDNCLKIFSEKSFDLN
jgi:PAS domain S-box-containing protein